MWQRMTRVAGLAVAAGLPHVTYAYDHVSDVNEHASWDAWTPQYDGAGAFGPLLRNMSSTSGSGSGQQAGQGTSQAVNKHTYPVRPAGYELLGIDWVLDNSYTPHLIEINSLPSMSPLDVCQDREVCAQLSSALGAEELTALQSKTDKAAVDAYKATNTLGTAAAASRSKQKGRVGAGTGRQLKAQARAASQGTSKLELVQRGFDMQKHIAVHDLMALIGLPVHPKVLLPDSTPGGGGGGRGGGGSQQGRAGLLWSWGGAARQEKQDKLTTDLGPAVHRGSGVVISLMAALLAQSLANDTAQSADKPAPVQGNASAVIATLGGWYPQALTAATRALPHLNGVMCEGLPPVVIEPDESLSPARRSRALFDELVIKTGGDGGASGRMVRKCEQACLWLQELQVLGEQEMEWSSKAAFQPLFPMQEAVRLNQQALAAARQADHKPGAATGVWTSTWTWLKALAGIKSSKWTVPGSPVVHAQLQLQPSHLDVLSKRAAAVRRQLGMKRDGLLAECTKSPEAAAVCAVTLMREVADTKCLD